VPEDLDRLVPLRADGTRPPLFCVHAISGSAYAYQGLVRLLDPEQPVYGFEAPGFDNDRPPVRWLPDLVEEYTSTLRAFRPDGGYRLLGWSMGAVLAFEMARRLAAAGAKVSALILVDPELPEPEPVPPEREILRRFVRDMLGMSGGAPRELTALYDSWPDHVDPEIAFEEIEQAKILPEEMDTVLLADQYAVFRAHFEGLCNFALTGTYHGSAVRIRAEQSPDDQSGWSKFLPGAAEFSLPGTHHGIWTGQSLTTMSEIVQRALDDC
jgi:thioesterase domain-containing protein